MLDLVEEFRVPVVDSTIFPLFLAKVMTYLSNYQQATPGEYPLAPAGKRNIVTAIYRRRNQTVAWTGKRIAVKTVIEYQARARSWLFLGRRKTYTPFPYRLVLNSHE